MRKSLLFRLLIETGGLARDQSIGGKPQRIDKLTAKQASPHNMAASRKQVEQIVGKLGVSRMIFGDARMIRRKWKSFSSVNKR